MEGDAISYTSWESILKHTQDTQRSALIAAPSCEPANSRAMPALRAITFTGL